MYVDNFLGNIFVMLAQHLAGQGLPVREVTFPDYASDSSALIKMYLAGQFGSKPDDVNAYAASSFFAVDRYASYKTDWGRFYEEGGVGRKTLVRITPQGRAASAAGEEALVRYFSGIAHRLTPEQRQQFFELKDILLAAIEAENAEQNQKLKGDNQNG